MIIKDLLRQGGLSFSFEFFPPTTSAGFDALYATIGELQPLNPTFVSVTYGAGGSTRRKTVDLVAKIKHELGLESMAHLTCVGATQADLREVLDELVEKKMENVLAVRGDPPRGAARFEPIPGGFSHANELVAYIRANYPFCTGVAGYPEGHREAPDLSTDLENLKRKVDAGAAFVITQLFFDNRYYFDFLDRATASGIRVPIIPGIMPILNVAQVKRFTQLCGATIPSPFLAQLEALDDDDDAAQQYGIERATQQCRNLLANGAPGIHFYTLNRSRSTWKIFENLKMIAPAG
ncbi:MAG: methylenetetrahydrofolate reductase [NAD(P)H] [Dehalococcoidia bacterium]|nr:methylenetetrahydrofolate reductase [NAD(P)H] [Dehalococcoidia bacterium]